MKKKITIALALVIVAMFALTSCNRGFGCPYLITNSDSLAVKSF